MFHRGSKLTLVDRGAKTAAVELAHPPGIYDAISRDGLCAGLRAALDIAAGGGTSVTVESAELDRAILRARW